MKKLVNAKWLRKNLENVKIFDSSWFINERISPLENFHKKRIPNSQFWDIDMISDTESIFPHQLTSVTNFESFMRGFGLENSDKVVIYDQLGVYSSAHVFFTLKYFGHQDIFLLDGGLVEFESGNETVSFEESEYNVNKIIPCFKNFEEVNEISNNKTGLIIDVRSEGRFNGTEKEPREGVRSGNIQNSINIPFPEFLDDNSIKFKNRDEIKALLERNYCNEIDKEIVFSCGSGVTACIGAFAIEEICEMENISIYDGSWTEYQHFFEE